MKKHTMTTVVVLAIIFIFSGNCLANNQVPPKKLFFAGENSEWLVIETTITTETAEPGNPLTKKSLKKEVVEIIPTPEFPDELSRDEALAVWQGKFEPKKSCSSRFLGFVNGISAIKECTLLSASIVPSPDNPYYIETKKTSLSGNSAIIWWPILGITGIFSFAIYIIRGGAPMKYMAQYSAVLIAFLVLCLIIDLIKLPTELLSLLLLIFWLLFCLIVIFYDRYWTKQCSCLKRGLNGLFGYYSLLMISILLAIVAVSKPAVSAEGIVFVFKWCLVAIGLVGLANIPSIRKKYFGWLL